MAIACDHLMTSEKTLTLLACQIAVPAMKTAQERDANLAASAVKVREHLKAATAPVDLIVLPELSSIDYTRATFDNLDQIAEQLDGPSFKSWSSVAQEFGVHIVYGFARQGVSARYITTGIIGPDGDMIGHYDKLHLAQFGASMEKEYFASGDHSTVFTINNFRIAPIICYDIRFPELARHLTLNHNVDLILHCGAYYRDPSFQSWHPFVITRALENQIAVLSLNRAGTQYGSSIFCPPWTDETTPTLNFADTSEDFRLINLDPEALLNARRTYSFLNDRLSHYNI